jgi:hypothetical protein
MRFGISDRLSSLVEGEKAPVDLIETFMEMSEVIEAPVLKKVKYKSKKYKSKKRAAKKVK